MFLASIMAFSAFSFAWVYKLGYANIWFVYGYAFLTGIYESTSMPIRQALVSNAVPQKYLSNAFTTNVLTIPGTRMLGPFVGGILASQTGFFWNLNLEAILYLLVVIFIIPMATPFAAKDSEDRDFKVSRLLGDFIDGFKYLFNQQRVLFKIMLLSFTPNVFCFPMLFLLPLFTAEILKEGADFGGYLLASNGLGGLIAIFLFSAFGVPNKRGLICILSALFAGILTLSLGQVTWMPISFLIVGLFGACISTFRTSNGVMTQTLVKDEYRVRTLSFYRFIMSFIVISSFIIGILTDLTSLEVVLFGMGMLAIIISSGFLFFSSSVRNQP